MTRLSVSLLFRKILSQKVRSSTYSSLHVSISDRSSILNGHLGLQLALPSGLPPRLLPLPLAEGRERNFEGSLPPLQPQVEGVLGRNWHARQSCSTDEWAVAVLRHDYRVPFHHLPLLSLEPRELLSCAPRLVHAQSLQEEVSKMLQKGALEPVDKPGPGFYSRLLLVEKVTGGWRPVIDLSTLNSFVTMTEFQMET